MKVAYGAFANVYDQLMYDVDYDSWVGYIEHIFNHYNKKPRYIAELGCGTGNITNRLAAKGYSLIGIDRSEDMLSIAQDKAMNQGVSVIYLHHDMRGLILPTELDSILCICDGFNYILKDNELTDIFKMVYEHLSAQGIFIFDLSSYYKLSEILGNNTFAENLENTSYIWENFFNENTKICEMDLTIFEKEGMNYRKNEEKHRQRAYKEEEIYKFLNVAGFQNVDSYNAFTFSEQKEKSERIYFVCRK